jgi:hypothetical protein
VVLQNCAEAALMSKRKPLRTIKDVDIPKLCEAGTHNIFMRLVFINDKPSHLELALPDSKMEDIGGKLMSVQQIPLDALADFISKLVLTSHGLKEKYDL